MRKLILFLFGLIFSFFLIGFGSSLDKSIPISYSFSSEGSIDRVIDFSSYVLLVSTQEDAICRYSSFSGVDYNSMENSFDASYGKLHQKIFTDVSDGLYKYYLKCRPDNNSSFEPSEWEISLRINSLITGEISLSKSEPLSEGKLDVKLVTSKVVSSPPTLSYSFDGITYNPLPLTGSGSNWKTYLLIDDKLKESVLFFKFGAKDLQGRQGTELTSGGIFAIDTVKPLMISNFEAIPYEGSIKLNWYSVDEDIDEFKIYKSESPNPSQNDYYKTVSQSPFRDSFVTIGKTYYYRISAVDYAGNEGELSLSVSSSPLSEGVSIPEGGLSPNLVSKVDNFLIELNSFSQELDSIENNFNSKSDKEKTLYSLLGLDKEIESIKRELSSLISVVGNYKLQSLDEKDLDNKLSSSRVKLNILYKKLPDEMIVLREGSSSLEMSEETIRKSILEIFPYIEDKSLDTHVKNSLKMLEENNFQGNSEYYNVEVVYHDGSNNIFSIVKRKLDSTFERDYDSNYLEILPNNFEDYEIFVKGSNYELSSDGSKILLGVDSKESVYYFLGDISIEDLKNIGFSYYHVSDEKIKPGITGYFAFSDFGRNNKFPLIIILILFFAGIVYLFYFRHNRFSEDYFSLISELNSSDDLLKEGDFLKIKKFYSSLNKKYSSLSEKEKIEIYDQLREFKDKFLILEFEKILNNFNLSGSKNNFFRMQEIYNEMSKDYKLKIEKSFNQIKEDFLK